MNYPKKINITLTKNKINIKNTKILLGNIYPIMNLEKPKIIALPQLIKINYN